MSTNTRREYVLSDVDAPRSNANAELNNALDGIVLCISVEYLREPLAAKPHVVFNFNCINPRELLDTNDQQSRGCRVSMDWSGLDNEGELNIKPRSYMGSSRLALGGLSFPVINLHEPCTLRDVINIFRGRHDLNTTMADLPGPDQRSQLHHLADLTRFEFVQPDPNNPALDGCRDFMYVLLTSININIYRMGC